MATKKVSTKKTTVQKKRSPKKQDSTIYIQIASYRDPELIPTIADAIAKAQHPKNLRFGICWQHSPYDEWDNLDHYINDDRFRIIDMDYREAKGVPYARYLLNKGWQGETYTLQLDSHHRFVENWDTLLIEVLEDLRKDGYEKPLLSSYIPSYNPTNDPNGRVSEPWIMEFDRFAPEGPVHFLPHTIDEFRELDKPVPSRFMSAHFIFADGKFCQEVEYDPTYYFHGEEINLAVRSYMAGYDLFAPHKVFAWHEYTREGKKKHWDDHSDWAKLDRESYKHGREILGMDDNNDVNKILKGTRSLQDYEIYAGLEFKTRKVHQKTVEKKRAPVSYDLNSHIEGLTYYQKLCIDLYKGSVPHEDYTFWAVAIHDKHGTEIFRQDADPNEINRMKTQDPTNEFLQVWRSFYHKDAAHSWVIWPHSKEHDWCERITGFFNED